MTNYLVKLFVRDSDNVGNLFVRESYGKLAGAVGILSNLLLFGLKLLVGILSGSISIMADAVNNLSDCASSVITLVGFKLSAMPPDEEHPYGHARFEYISGLVVSFLILAIGLEFLMSSVRKILNPQPVLFSWVVALVLAASILVKLWQGLFNRQIGKRIGSSALEATATDSINDVITTAVVLAGAAVGHFTGLLIDGWMGLLVAVFILVSGVRLVKGTLDELLGMAPDRALVANIERKIRSYESVMGIHDLIVHNYGPGRCFASVHVEVPASQDILVSHDIIDNIERDFSNENGIELVIHLDPIVVDDPMLDRYRYAVEEVVREIDPVLSIHDFRMVDGKTHTNFIFDVLVPPRYGLTDAALRQEIAGRIKRQGRDIYCIITVDRSYTSNRQEMADETAEPEIE